MIPDRPTTKHIPIKMGNVKGGERFLRVIRQGQLFILKATPIRPSELEHTEEMGNGKWQDLSLEKYVEARLCLDL